jgi:hypothetical protein
MAKTVNAYVPDHGEITVSLTADDVTAITEITTEEVMTLDIAVRKFEETTPRTKEYSEIYVTGSNLPIKTISTKVNATVWTLTLVDDYSLGLAGELGGTPWLTAIKLFELFFNNNRAISQMTVTPAGSGTANIETTLVNIDIQTIPHPMVDSENNAPNEISITLVVESFTKAAHG